MKVDPVAARLCADWGFVPTEELPGGYCSRVYADRHKVLKVPFQGEEQISGLTAALAMQDGIGPKIHAYDLGSGSLLMERIVSGTDLSLTSAEERVARDTVVGLASRLRALPPTGLAPLESSLRACPLLNQLQESAPPPVFLHGDLHHGNVLRGPKGWTAIDPKGFAGDPSFEFAAFVRNPVTWLFETEELSELLEDRIRFFAEVAGCEPWRIWGWSVLAIGSDDGDSRWNTVHLALSSLNYREC